LWGYERGGRRWGKRMKITGGGYPSLGSGRFGSGRNRHAGLNGRKCCGFAGKSKIGQKRTVATISQTGGSGGGERWGERLLPGGKGCKEGVSGVTTSGRGGGVSLTDKKKGLGKLLTLGRHVQLSCDRGYDGRLALKGVLVSSFDERVLQEAGEAGSASG